MSLDKVKDFFSNLSKHDLPTAVAVLVGIVLLFLIFRTEKSYNKVIAFFIAAGLFVGAWWWHQHK